MKEYYKMAIKYLHDNDFIADYFFLGNPRTIITDRIPLPLIRQWNGRNPIFISHNTYPSYNIIDGKIYPTSINLRRIFFDFDHNTKPENAFADAKRLSQFLENSNIPHITHYSGKKGFHVFIQLQPRIYKLNIRSETELKNRIAEIQLYLKQRLHLKTLDTHIVGDIKRLVRVPYLLHQASKRIPFPLNISEFDSVDDVIKISTKPSPITPHTGTRNFTLPQLYRFLKISPENIRTFSRTLNFSNTLNENAKNFALQLMAVKPCILDALTSNNPPHYARVQAALFAKANGITMDAFIKIWHEFAERYNYVDYHNTQYRLSQIRNIYDNPRYMKEATCGTIRRRSYLCLGAPEYDEDGKLISGCIKYKDKKF